MFHASMGPSTLRRHMFICCLLAATAVRGTSAVTACLSRRDGCLYLSCLLTIIYNLHVDTTTDVAQFPARKNIQI